MLFKMRNHYLPVFSTGVKNTAIAAVAVFIITILSGCKKNSGNNTSNNNNDPGTNQTVYVADNSSVIYALDATTGVLRWLSQTNITGGSYYYDGLAVSNGIIYHNTNFTMYALDTIHGKVKWTMSSQTWFAPAIANGMVYMLAANGTQIAAYGFTDNYQWGRTLAGLSFSAPAVANGIVYLGDGTPPSGHLYAYNANTGIPEWTITDTLNFSRPIVVDGKIYASVYGGYNNGVVAMDTAGGKRKWTSLLHTFDFFDLTPAVSGNTVYAASDSGNLYAFDITTGALKWKVLQTLAKPGFSSPVCANNLVYIGSNAYDSLGNLKWSVPGGYTTPVLANNVLYVTGGGNPGNTVYALDPVTGAQKWTYNTGGSQLISNGLSVVTTTGKVYQ